MSTHHHGRAVSDGLREPARALRQAIPEVLAGFASLHKAAMAPGALDARTKELIALAIAVATRCDGCIASHARGAVRAGATAEDAAEAIGVAILMSGGPGTVYGPRALDAVNEFLETAQAQGQAQATT
ncbi:MAG: carboxymuconolactone decarboxylase family protein [Ilumatobacteraceae bacterium]|jgi:AhpD family alkylhydroperoxidase